VAVAPSAVEAAAAVLSTSISAAAQAALSVVPQDVAPGEGPRGNRSGNSGGAQSSSSSRCSPVAAVLIHTCKPQRTQCLVFANSVRADQQQQHPFMRACNCCLPAF
jgi:hypothetical protein